MKAFVKEYVMGCAICQQNKTITQRNQPPLQPIGLEEKPLPFATMSVDFVVKTPAIKRERLDPYSDRPRVYQGSHLSAL